MSKILCKCLNNQNLEVGITKNTDIDELEINIDL